MSNIARALGLVAGLFCVANAANADTRWDCWYAPSNVSIRCVLDHQPDSDPAIRAADYQRVADPRHPELVRTIRSQPELLAGREVRIPMWNTPYEMDRVRELAESVMCGIQRDCNVEFDSNTDGRAGLRFATRIAERLDGEQLDVFSREVLDTQLVEEVTPAVEPAPQRRSVSRRSRVTS